MAQVVALVRRGMLLEIYAIAVIDEENRDKNPLPAGLF